jgi:hypothetical protein
LPDQARRELDVNELSSLEKSVVSGSRREQNRTQSNNGNEHRVGQRMAAAVHRDISSPEIGYEGEC